MSNPMTGTIYSYSRTGLQIRKKECSSKGEFLRWREYWKDKFGRYYAGSRLFVKPLESKDHLPVLD